MEDLEIIKAILAEKEKALHDKKEERFDVARQADAVHAKVLELQGQLHVLEAAEETMRTKNWSLRTEIREIERVIDRRQRERTRVEKEITIKKDLDAKGKILEILTESRVWNKDAKPHQRSGAKQLAVAGRGILGDKRGLGKTLTSMMWLDMLLVKKAIIFLPKETASAFRKQMPRWASHRPLFDMTSKPANEKNALLEILPLLEEYTLLVNVESWRRDPTFIPKLQGLGVQAVVIDEAHVMKDQGTYAFKGVRDVVYPYEQDELNTVKNVLPMSGTLFLNYPDEMWPLLHLVDRHSWPTLRAFKDDYLIQDANGRWRFNEFNGAKETLLEQLGLRLVQRDRKAAGVVIPPQEVVMHELEFTAEKYPRQYDAYQKLEIKSAMLLSNMDEQKAIGVEGLALMTRLRQMITWPMGIELKDPMTGEVLFKCDINESVKMDAATRIISQLVLMEDERVVVFSQFKAPLKETYDRLTALGIRAVVLDGGTTDKTREAIKKDFDADQTDPTQAKWDVVLANYKVAGQSLDFTGATQVLIIDSEWSPGRAEQAYGRVDRMGQERPTTVHVLHTPDTVDVDMANLIDIKAEQQGLFETALKAATDYLREKAS
jgi:SNF2 family DNA or RNA helicase